MTTMFYLEYTETHIQRLLILFLDSQLLDKCIFNMRGYLKSRSFIKLFRKKYCLHIAFEQKCGESTLKSHLYITYFLLG